MKNTITQEWEEGFFSPVVVFYSGAHFNKHEVNVKTSTKKLLFLFISTHE